ncbi:ribosomal protein, S31 [Nesidiocoris tenuis]|uniref:Small ribosomal subunit protein mS31 n=1 Tax=Nesidiocoris tenuis TaxID=355587 RepID=A0ABN7A6J4_9HEMI|nr:ribosomal protein, S31 [Nesidiocoris tenuis]
MLITIHHLARRSSCLRDSARGLTLSSVPRSTDSPSDGSDDGSSKKKANEKLNSLLLSIAKDESLSKKDDRKYASTPRPLIRERKVKERKDQNLGEKIVFAAKEVARNLDGQPEKSEAELLHKVVGTDVKLQKSIFKASSSATLGALLNELKIEKQQQAARKSARSSSGPDTRTDVSRSDLVQSQWKGRMARDSFKGAIQPQPVGIYSGQALGIFKPDGEYSNDIQLETWNQCVARELKFAFTQPPRNIWEQMIVWTERGMLWKFPIDNEQDLEDRPDESFVDHVFLENYLDDWCPKSGPIRHFMELVCVGLSRNHWLDAQEKRDHMMWYKEYFIAKKALIKEIGAGEIVETSPSPQLETPN